MIELNFDRYDGSQEFEPIRLNEIYSNISIDCTTVFLTLKSAVIDSKVTSYDFFLNRHQARSFVRQEKQISAPIDIFEVRFPTLISKLNRFFYSFGVLLTSGTMYFKYIIL